VSRRAAAPVAVLAVLLALAGCDGTPSRPDATVRGEGVGSTTQAPTPATPTPTPAATPAATPTVPRAYATGAPPAEQPGLLADATPGGAGGWLARLWFGGVRIGVDHGKPLVAYASVELNSDGTRTVAHAKLTLFHCQRREAAGSANFLGCTGRAVEYGDLDPDQLRVDRTSTGAFTVSGRFPTYTYGSALDRGPDLPLRWTGRTFPVRVTCAPDPERLCRPGRPGRSVASASVVLGHDPVAGRAGLDFGYLNRLTQ
jgi:hypothetical protein